MSRAGKGQRKGAGVEGEAGSSLLTAGVCKSHIRLKM